MINEIILKEYYIRQIKERVFELERKFQDLQLDMAGRATTKGLKEKQEESRKITDEICWRIQDYEDIKAFPQEMWDLNYEYEAPESMAELAQRVEKKYPIVPLKLPTGNEDEDMENFRLTTLSVGLQTGYTEGWFDAMEYAGMLKENAPE